MTPPVIDDNAGGENVSLLSDDAPAARVTAKASTSKKS